MSSGVAPHERLLSLDVFRGIIMVLLTLESTGLYNHLYTASEGHIAEHVLTQFFHHPWNGLRFWDLIQPGFMFIAGTAMAYSLDKQFRAGSSWGQAFRKVLKRSWWLFFWGVLDYAVQSDGSLAFKLWDVLTQLSFTTLVAFLLFRSSYLTQIIACMGLLLLTELLYRLTNVPGFNQPFTDQQNFGNYMDLILMNLINKDGWVAINCIPTSVHTIAGMMAGKMLIEKKPISWMIWAGVITFVAGFALDLSGITPIIKRIATTSFTLASLGYCLLALVLFYWWVDQLGHRKHWEFFTIVGMNSIFIYLFLEIVGHRWFNEYIGNISNGLMKLTHIPELPMFIITSLIIFGLEWGLCYFLYRKKIFFKL
jgi:predicted acyltransferase